MFNNPVASLNATLFNETFKILSSAHPSAASYLVVDVRQIALPTASASRSSASSIASISSAATPLDTSPPTSSNSPTNIDISSISGGAIRGIVGGIAGGLALLGSAGWLLWRRRRNGHHEVAQDDMPELSAEDIMYAQMKAGGDITEISSDSKPVELEQPPVELDATERVTSTEDRR
jgi:LPXTG-motif cell wall-anchored protein